VFGDEIIRSIYLLGPIIALTAMSMIALAIAASGESRTVEGNSRCIAQCEKICFLAFAFALAFSASHFASMGKPHSLYHGAVYFDRFSVLSNVLFSIMALYTTFIASGDSKNPAAFRCEFYPLLMLATAGAMIMTMGADLIVIIIGIEILSLATYSMVALDRKNLRATEGAFKYFLMGAAASAVFLFGTAHIYGATGTTLLRGIGIALKNSAVVNVMFLPVIIGTAMVLIAMAFKLAAVPFHMWSPDAYDGASVPAAAFMTYFVKAAGFITLFRIAATAFFPFLNFFSDALTIVAAVTMTFANIAALTQPNIKRMLAYSSISHTGYLLIAVLALNSGPQAMAAGSLWAGHGTGTLAGSAMFFYLTAYFFINLGLFAALAMMTPETKGIHAISDFAGLGFSRPFFAAAVSLFFLALAGLPATSGFTGKFFIFMAGFSTGHLGIVLCALLNSLIAFYYYTRIIVSMYMEEPKAGKTSGALHENAEAAFCILISMAMITAMGVYPDPFMYIMKLAARGMFGL